MIYLYWHYINILNINNLIFKKIIYNIIINDITCTNLIQKFCGFWISIKVLIIKLIIQIMNAITENKPVIL